MRAAARKGGLLRPVPEKMEAKIPAVFWDTHHAALNFARDIDAAVAGLSKLPRDTADVVQARERARVSLLQVNLYFPPSSSPPVDVPRFTLLLVPQKQSQELRELLDKDGSLSPKVRDSIVSQAQRYRLSVLKMERAAAEVAVARWRVRDMLRPYMQSFPEDDSTKSKAGTVEAFWG